MSRYFWMYYLLGLCSFTSQATLIPPPGFESLLEGQTEQIEVLLPGHSLGLFPVVVKPDTVQFMSPLMVLESSGLAALPAAERQKALAALSRPLLRNSNLVCGVSEAKDSSECGYVATDKEDVAVIFDENNGQLSLFLNRDWLPDEERRDKRWLTPTPEGVSAFIHRQTLYLSDDLHSRNMTLNGSGALGLGDGRYLGGNWAASGRHPQSVHASMTCQTSMNASLSVPVGNWYALLGYSTSRTEGRPVYRGYDDNSDKENVFWRQAYIPASHRESAQASATYSLNMAGMNINTHGGVWRTRNDGVNDDGLFMSVSVSYASQPPTMTGSNGYTSAGTDIHSSRNQKTQTSWNVNHVRSWQQDLYRELSVGFSGYNDDSWSGSLGGRMSGRMGELSATISNSHQRNAGSASSLTAGYSSSLALSRNGLFWGGGQDGEPASGMAVNVESEGDEGSSGKVVSVRGSSQPFSLGFGQQSLLLMEGYNATEVTIEDAGVSSQGMAGVKAGGGSRRYFLTPGHLLVHNISASMSRLYVGRVLDKDGRPLLDAQPLNHPFLSLGPSGRFSLQSEHKESSRWLLSKNRILRCPMSVHKRRDVMQVVGDVRCELSDVDALPQALQISPRVIRLLNVAGLLRHAVQEA
ncbi:CS1-pili formation C-terminal domain-containing protein [Salmonella enterica]|nr:CS1-pili formation C-terminal domain-containing protein [Salmonella enterica]EIF0327686.1 CS1-pili formation C-terminal domain-containing protein [Salmonella enterica]